MADKRTPEQIERDLEMTRQRLAENISQLVTEIHPKVVVHRTIAESKRTVKELVEDAKRTARESADKMKRVFKDDGGWNWRNVGIAAAATAVLVTVVVASKKGSHG